MSMKIHSNYNVNHHQSHAKPAFKAWNREVFKKIQYVDYYGDSRIPIPEVVYLEVIKHRNDTAFFRDGIFWDKLSDLLVKKYQSVEKVNVYDYACSNGSEAYTFIMQMLSKYDEKVAKKFFPVLAKDYDEFAIEKALEYKSPISPNEISAINKYTNQQFGRYFGEGTNFDKWRNGEFSVKPELIENVVFTKANIMTDCENIEPENSVVFARNFWPYLNKSEQKELAQKLHDCMGKNSTLIIGEYDLAYPKNKSAVDSIIEDTGFRRVMCRDFYGLIFEK